jgi:hypothetical protein
MLAMFANRFMGAPKIPPHHLLANLPHPSTNSSTLDPAEISKAAEHLGRCTTGHVLQHLGLPITRPNEMAVAKHLRGLGYVKARARVGDSLHWVFFPPTD